MVRIQEKRLELLKSAMESEGIDVAFLIDPANLYYFTGVNFYYQDLALRAGTAAALLVPRELDPIFVVNIDDIRRVKENLKAHLSYLEEYQQPGTLIPAIWRALSSLQKSPNEIVVGVEGNFLCSNIYESLRQKSREIKDITGIILDLRAVKSEDELSYMRKAAEIADKGIRSSTEAICEDKSEKEVAAFCEYTMMAAGADGISFKTIIASGENTAVPNWITSETKIKPGGLVYVDLGCIYGGYCSDMTRTFSYKASSEQEDLLEKVIEMERAAIEAVEPGIPQLKIDDLVTELAEKMGLRKYLFHASHGIGLNVVEKPFVAARSPEPFQVGMTLTIEVGLYIPKLGGARMEDVVHVTEGGAEILTKFPREIDELRLT